MSTEWDIETVQTVLYGLAMVALGFWFGNQFTGRLAYQEFHETQTLADLTVSASNPEWYSTVQSAQRIAIITSGICILGVIVADYYAVATDEQT